MYVTGDFNVRFQAQHKNDLGVTGPYTYGKGPQFIDHTAQSNRSLCVKTMKLQNMVEIASYKTTTPLDQVTYRDKSAPPPDWSQFLLDPLILQQVYTTMHRQLGDELARNCAQQVRAFLTSELPLPPPLPPPSADPIRFQGLDHTFTRQQWLPSVHSCKSKLHTGFPSDHYLLVTEIRVKLRATPPKQPTQSRRPRAPTPSEKSHYNALLRGQEARDNLPIAESVPRKATFFTDGAGTGGKCRATTPAGWGWTGSIDHTAFEASGPVITMPDHAAYLGAAVGSNNTGELTAIFEALLFAEAQGCTAVRIHSDSQWAIKVSTGAWRASSHKILVNQVKRIVDHTAMTVSFHWVKGHSGVSGNERADRLAAQGRDTQQRTGGRDLVLPPPPPQPIGPTTPPDELVRQALKAANLAFSPTEFPARTPWITPPTLSALAEARQANAKGWATARALRNKAKRMARKDKVAWVHRQLLEDPHAEHSKVWDVVRRQKKGFQGKKTHLVVNGKPVPWSQRHIAMKNHLETKQWKCRPRPPNSNTTLKARPQLHPTQQDEEQFTLEELQVALRKLKRNKAPGPDQSSNELWIWLDSHGELQLLSTLNEVWNSETIPPSWTHAVVVTIYKGKGDDTDPESYRPISLLNTMYKLFAMMMQTRLALQSEKKLRQTQYGFRASRGTKHPLFILRRAMEYSTMTSNPMHCLFLDWKQAFDSVDHTALMIALERFGLSNKMLKLIEGIYQAPTFEVKGICHTAAKGQVQAGIRQGCPLVRTFS